MKSRWERWQTAGPPKKVTRRKVIADIITVAVAFGGYGLITDDWDGAIGKGASIAGANLLYQWWNGRTVQPEDEDGADE